MRRGRSGRLPGPGNGDDVDLISSGENTDGVRVELSVATQHALHHEAATCREADTVSRKQGGWRYSVGRLLQAVLYAHYLRCAADFARSVVFAVAFALGPKAGSGSGRNP